MAKRKRAQTGEEQLRLFRGDPEKPLKVPKRGRVSTTDDLPLADGMEVRTGLLKRRTLDGSVVRSEEFDRRYFFDGSLGALFSPDKTMLRLWAPTAQNVEVEVYGSIREGSDITARVPMRHREPGLWETEIPGNCHGMVYTYRLTFSD